MCFGSKENPFVNLQLLFSFQEVFFPPIFGVFFVLLFAVFVGGV